MYEKGVDLFRHWVRAGNCRTVLFWFFGSFFNGVDYGSACLLGMGMYLCIVVVTCTGIIVSKVTCRKNEDNSEEKDK